jgi:hypothetical protein
MAYIIIIIVPNMNSFGYALSIKEGMSTIHRFLSCSLTDSGAELAVYKNSHKSHDTSPLTGNAQTIL